MAEKRWSSMLGAIKRLSTLKLNLAYLKAERPGKFSIA
ncbi:hypothetical protein PSHT_04367 [Puccinia striiformis]|uniref:Uncharacterized protein n=2 Tax=Puccinia striiformis TaxID=27350 RepID=A0A2S4WD95_9BASI|nr:hypothetical protein PSTT_09067 [Puccinia striiformis]POW19709.1 hypothetical protein PSHT_04367 [Puccinia striiformis]